MGHRFLIWMLMPSEIAKTALRRSGLRILCSGLILLSLLGCWGRPQSAAVSPPPIPSQAPTAMASPTAARLPSAMPLATALPTATPSLEPTRALAPPALAPSETPTMASLPPSPSPSATAVTQAQASPTETTTEISETPALPPTTTATPSAVAASATVTMAPPAGQVVGRILIPRVGIAAPIVRVSWHVEQIEGQPMAVWDTAAQAAGHHRGSSAPGDAGNCVISGHSKGEGGVFDGLVDLVPGDSIQIIASDGQRFQYTVEQVHKVEELGQPLARRVENATFMAPTGDTRLTLITCWPQQTYTHRIVVVARPINV